LLVENGRGTVRSMVAPQKLNNTPNNYVIQQFHF
jgi:hypothetical protein